MNCDWRTAKKRYEIQQQLENGQPLPLKEHKSILDPYVDIINRKGEPLTFNIFLFTLPFSEKKYCRLTLDKKQDTVINSLIYVFRYIKGIPKEIWFDNMLTIVDSAKMGKHDRVNDKIKQFAKDMAFTPIPCRPRRPQIKGTVEALAKLCDRLLAYNHEFETIEDLETIVNTFTENINNETSQAHNRIVNEVFTYEKEYLQPLPNDRILNTYLSNRQTRKVAKDSMVSYKNNKYSVPVKYIGFNLNVIEKDNYLYIYDNTNLVRCHQILNNPLNYNKDDIKDILASDLLRNSTEEKIEAFIADNLSQYDNLL